MNKIPVLLVGSKYSDYIVIELKYMIMKTFLDIPSKNLTGNDLFTHVMDKVNKLQQTEVDEWDDMVTIKDIELFIDGEHWMFVHNAKMQLTGITPLF